MLARHVRPSRSDNNGHRGGGGIYTCFHDDRGSRRDSRVGKHMEDATIALPVSAVGCARSTEETGTMRGGAHTIKGAKGWRESVCV